MESVNITYELLHKYNVQGPRYTSYPPAPSWKSEIGPQDHEAIIEASNAVPAPAPLSLYLHLPFCEMLCYFCACTTVITGKNRAAETPYRQALNHEIDWLSARIDKKRPVVQLHLGGGTPTYSAPLELERLVEKLRDSFSFATDAEVGAEVDPRVTTKEHLKALKKVGFNRLSMGLQDFDPAVQKAVNRVQPYEETLRLVEAARELGFSSINFDLIYGLPHQTPASFRKTVEQVLSIGPDRLAVYSYAHVPWLKSHQQILAEQLPTEREKFEIFLIALKLFTEAGFDYIGMDHFARPGDELSKARRERTLWRNFQGYTTKAGTDLFGLGMSAISNVNGNYVQNQKDLKSYQPAAEKSGSAAFRGFSLTKDDKARGRVIQNLLCHALVRKSEIENEFGLAFDSYFQDPLAALKVAEGDGLVELGRDEIRPTATGRVFLRNLAMPFDAYLPQEGEKKIFSRTV